MEDLINLENWKEISKGYYHFTINPRCAYEIVIKFWYESTNILTANADLYVVGEWDGDSGNFIKRELILSGPVCACLEKAFEVNHCYMPSSEMLYY